MKNIETYTITLNRTILAKTKSHGAFISSKEIGFELFGVTQQAFNSAQNSCCLAIQNFFTRNDYHSSSSPKAYELKAIKNTLELRITNLAKIFKALEMTETDEFVLEKVTDNNRVVYLADKVSKPSFLIVEKIDTGSEFWVWDNSYNSEIWGNILNQNIKGIFKDKASSSEVTFHITKNSTAQINCGQKTQTKSLFSINVYKDNSQVPLDGTLFSIEKLGNQIIIKHKEKKNTVTQFSVSI